MKRREFIWYGAGAFLAAPLTSISGTRLFANTPGAGSRIVSIYDRNATNMAVAAGTEPTEYGIINDVVTDYSINGIRVNNMVDAAVKEFTGKHTVGAAWESLFPEGHPNAETRIGIKINLSYGEGYDSNNWSRSYCPFGAKALISDAIVMGLSQMLDGTFPVENITIFDKIYSVGSRKRYPIIQGYRPVEPDNSGLVIDKRPGTYGVHWVSRRYDLEIPQEAPSFIAAPDYSGEYKAPQKIFKAAYDNDFMVNVAIAKDHRAAGITGAMKNYYGCTDNPNGTHGNLWMNDDSPYAGTRLCVPVFYKSVDQVTPCILNVLDGLAVLYNGGPLSGNVYQANTIAVSKDPVAMDTYVMGLVNHGRDKNGYEKLTTNDGRIIDRHPNASHVRIASEHHNMGSMSLDNLITKDISDSKEVFDIPQLGKSVSRVSDVSQNSNGYRMWAFFDDSGRQQTIDSYIEDQRGKRIRQQSSITTSSAAVELEWNGRDDNDAAVSPGLYTWNVEVGGKLHTKTVNSY